jgi:hypothetical protein
MKSCNKQVRKHKVVAAIQSKFGLHLQAGVHIAGTCHLQNLRVEATGNGEGN